MVPSEKEHLLGIVVPHWLNEQVKQFMRDEGGKIKEHGARAILHYIESEKVRVAAARRWKKRVKQVSKGRNSENENNADFNQKSNGTYGL